MTKWRPPGSPPSSAQQLLNFLRYNQEPTEIGEEPIKNDNEPGGSEDQTPESYDKTTASDDNSTKSIAQATETDEDSTECDEESKSSDEKPTKSEDSDGEKVGDGQGQGRFPSVPGSFSREEASSPQVVGLKRKVVFIQYGSCSYGYRCGRCQKETRITCSCESGLPQDRRSGAKSNFTNETGEEDSTCCVQ